jgi:DNA-binding transcriptional MerR regulator
MSDFYLASEAARELNVSAATVRLLEGRGTLPAIRTPTGVRIFAGPDIRKLKALRAKSRGSKSA